MKKQRVTINGIPSVIWGEASTRAYLCVHGKLSCADAFEGLAALAEERGFQTLSFDLPQHGRRVGEPDRCDVWNGMRDLAAVGDFAFARWEEVNLYACSLGAYFSLNTWPHHRFGRCLFQSPIVDMEYLVEQMMVWFDVSAERLEREGEIDTPIDPLRWDYYMYIKNHPAEKWPSPTRILYGGRDELQSAEVIRLFAERFGCTVTLAPESEHSFMSPGDAVIAAQWLRDNL